jgi:ribosome biogenesis GTPase A
MNNSWHGSLVLEECKRLRSVLLPISKRYYGPLEKIYISNTLYPFVLLLGNHSSGKSSFVNFICHRKIQNTGVAPTDDNFTVIASSSTSSQEENEEHNDLDRNGAALIGDPDLGFDDLKVFGPILTNHTQLKVRKDINCKNFMIIDSPGMIDSPVARNQSLEESKMDRGYDFEAVCSWYAERADVILLFFDPDKPGKVLEFPSLSH